MNSIFSFNNRTLNSNGNRRQHKITAWRIGWMFLCLLSFFRLSAQSGHTIKSQLIALNKTWQHIETEEAFFDREKTFTSDVDLIQTHLSWVETYLRAKSVSHLNREQQRKRQAALDMLHRYWTKGQFPINTYHKERTPYFIDVYGTYCAVGYLIKETGFDALAQRIHREHNYGYINELKQTYSEINTWASTYGFTTDELAWIQPTYWPYFGNYNCFSPTYSTQFTVIPASCQNLCNGNIIVPTHNPWSLQPIVSANIIPASNCGNLCAGVYTIMTVDATNSSSSFGIYVGIDAPSVTIDIQAVTCNTLCNGAIGFDSIAGNQNPTQYRLYQNGNLLSTQNTPLFTSLCTGTYNLGFSVPNGCSWNYGPYTINQGNLFNSNANISSAILCNGDSGIVQVSAVGGTPPYNGTGTFPVLAGTHIFQVTDANNCLSIDTLQVNQPAPFILSNYVYTPIDCYGDSATVILYANGGTPPYNGVGTFQLPAGTHSFSISDSNNCVSSNTLTVNQPDPLVINDSIITPILCHGDSALVQISGNGGTSPYTGTGNFTYPAGTYTISISDSNNCTTSANINISEPQTLSLNLTMFPNNGTNNGTAVCNPLGGTPPYTFSWNTGGTTDALFNLGTGWYTCTLSDVNGCSKTDSIFVPFQFPQGITNSENPLFTVSPNPNRGYIFIQFSERQSHVYLTLRNTLGQSLQVKHQRSVDNIYLDMQSYPPGMYCLHINNGNRQQHIKLIKE